MLTDICSKIDMGEKLRKPFTIKDWSVNSYNNAKLFLSKELSKGGELQLVKKPSGEVLGMLTLAHMKKFENFLLDDSRSPSTYRQIKNSQEWQGIYEFAPRNLWYMNGGRLSQKMEMTVPCAECGVLLPERLMSVDHQRAKGNGRPFDAVYKLFKAVGYTEQPPAGVKAKDVLRRLMSSVGGKDTGSGVRELNAVGVIVFSLFYGSDVESNLRKLCMHHFVNLRPVCVACNSSLGMKL